MHKLATLRWTLPAIAILTVVVIALVAVAVVAHVIPGITAWSYAA